MGADTRPEASKEEEKLLSVEYRRESFLDVDWGTANDLDQPLVLLPELPSDSTNPLAKVAVLDRQLDALSAQSAAIRTWRNHFLPVACLDDDLLSEIFQWVALAHPSDIPRSRSWVSLMLVCRRWRAIGVSSSVLWSVVIVGGERLVKPSPLHMERSGMRPLALHIDLNTKHFIDAAFSTTPATLLHSTLSILKPHFDRVMVLDIKAAREELSQFLFRLGRTKRPNLRCLRVVFDSKEATFLPLAFDLSVTQNLIARAEVVMLTDVVVYWTDLRNLTKLRIQLDPSRSRDAYARKMSCTTAITMLRFSPALEELVLQNCFKYSPLEIDLTSTSPPVHLPVLRVCNLCASGSVCATFLAATRIPPLARLQVEVSEEDWDGRAVRVLLEVLRTNFAQPGAPTLRVLQIDDRKSGKIVPGCCQCYRWFADLVLDQFESFAEPGAAEEMANLSLRMPGNNGEHGRWLLQHVLYSGPAKDVQVCDWPMCVPAWRAWPHDVLCDLLRLLPALQSLVLRHTGAKNVLRLRAALQQMVMHDVCNELSEEEPPKGMTIYWIQLLHQSLQAESTKKIRELVDAQMLAGRPLQRLFLHPEFLDQEHLKILIERWATREVKVGTEEATFIEVELV